MVAIKEGRSAHEQIIQSGWDSHVKVGNCLVDMYPKCGSVEDAWKVSTRWHHMMWSLGVPYFEDVPCMGIVRKLLNILNRCVKKVYSQMISLSFVFCQLVAMQVWWVQGCAVMLQSTVYMISAKLEHCTCMIDLLGHAGHLQEAENMTKAMPHKPHVNAWKALLGACRIHGNVEMGDLLLNRLLNWSLKMLQAMCSYQTSVLLLELKF
jgi:hypothetical protein